MDLLLTIIIGIIAKAVIKQLKDLTGISSAEDIAEMLKAKSMQMLSLIGIPNIPDLSIIEEVTDLL